MELRAVQVAGNLPLWISNWQNANDEQFYKTKGIKARLTVMNDDLPFYQGPLLVTQLRLDTPDGPGFTMQHLLTAVGFLDFTLYYDLPTLVHCCSGRSRSVACAVAYLVKHYPSVDPDQEAKRIRYLRGEEANSLPHSHIWGIVKEFLNSLHKEW